MTAVPSPVCAPTQSREQLVVRLHQASEAEHSLCCQYLYAAFSLRRLGSDFPTPRCEAAELLMAATQQWAYQIFYIARQEMSHLAVATNLLSAIGEPPHLSHGGYPDTQLGALVGAQMVLERCSEATLRRFQYIERPKAPGFGSSPGVECIYDDIKGMFSCLPANELFKGEGERQLSSAQLDFGVSMQIPPVTNRPSAIAAINLVLAEGEGLGVSPLLKDTHYARFTALLESYAQVAALAQKCGPNLDLSLPVVPNPVSRTGPGPLPEHATLVTNAFSAELMDFFNHGYRLMLIMLQEFLRGYRSYSGIFEAVEALKTPEQLTNDRLVTIMAENAYFPFMTMFIRPVGELLARQPAFPNVHDEARAGASFQTGGDIPTCKKDICFYVDGLACLQQWAAKLATDAPDPISNHTLSYLAKNLTRMRTNMQDVWNQNQ
jgi:hypothetical protein